MKNATLTAIADLANATVAYENAWRAQWKLINLPGQTDDVAYAAYSETMHEQFKARQDAQAKIAADLGVEVAAAMFGAVTAASAQTAPEDRGGEEFKANRTKSFIRDEINFA